MSLPFAIPVLQTDRLTLRAPRESDVAAMIEFGKSERSRFVGGPIDAVGAWRAIMAGVGHWAFKGHGYWSVERRSDGAFIGRAGVIKGPDDQEPELAYHFFDGFEGQGYATEAVLAARAYCQDVLGMAPLASFIDPDNARSIALARRVGAALESSFQEDGKTIQVWRHPGGAA
ncbi:MAG: GNAT family N-acetyltransferase [Paracoccaceae bacterium]